MITIKNRRMIVPPEEKYLGTERDSNSSVRIFSIPRYMPHDMDLSSLAFFLDIRYEDNRTNETTFTDVLVTDNSIELTWNITANDLGAEGVIFLQIKANDLSGLVKWYSFAEPFFVGDIIDGSGNYSGNLSTYEVLASRCILIENRETSRILSESEREVSENERVEKFGEWSNKFNEWQTSDYIHLHNEITGARGEYDNLIDRLQDIDLTSEKKANKIDSTKYIGFPPSNADYICDGIRDDAQFNMAVNDLVNSGGKITVLQGTYHISKKTNLCSNLIIELEKGAKLVMDPQVSAVITTPIAIGGTTTTVAGSDIDKFQVGMEIGFITDGSTGYKHGEDASIITEISGNTITFSAPATKVYTNGISTIVSLNSCFAGIDTFESILTDIEIIGGEFDGNKASTHTWVRDLHQNGLIFGGVHNLKLKGVIVHDFNFQNIHVSGTMAMGSNKNTVLEYCIAYGSGASGICLDTVPDETMVINCFGYENGNSGLQLVDVSKCTVIGGSYHDNSFCGVRSAHDDNVVKENKFIGVSVARNRRGFGIRNNEASTLENCHTEDNTDYGICLEEDCHNIIVSNCTFKDEVLGINEFSTGAFGNIVTNPSFINCATNLSLPDALLLDGTGGQYAVNKLLVPNRMKINAANNHMQFAEGGATRWHMETVEGVFSLVESGVLERLIIAGNDANFQTNIKMRKFGCNGKDPQESATIGIALPENLTEITAADLNNTNAILNQIRNALINCGICN